MEDALVSEVPKQVSLGVGLEYSPVWILPIHHIHRFRVGKTLTYFLIKESKHAIFFEQGFFESVLKRIYREKRVTVLLTPYSKKIEPKATSIITPEAKIRKMPREQERSFSPAYIT